MLQSIIAMVLEYRGVYKKIWWVLPATFFIVAASLIEPYIYKLIVDGLSNQTGNAVDFSDIAWLVWGWAGVLVISIVVEFFRDYYAHYFMHKEWSMVVSRGMTHFLKKGYDFHLQMNNAEKIKIFSRGVDATYDVTQKLILDVSRAVLVLLGYTILAFWVSWQVTTVLLLLTPLLLIVPLYLGSYVHAAQARVTKLWDAVYSHAGDSITNILVVKLFHRISERVEINRASVLLAANEQSVLSRIWAFLEAFSQGINLVLSVVVLSVSLLFYSKWMITLGDIFLFTTIASKLAAPFLQLERTYRDVVRLVADYSKYQGVLALPDEQDEGTIEFPKNYKNIVFDSVSFTYPNTTRKVLDKVTIELERGKKIALVGHTGSGKSTLSALLGRFYLPTDGVIRVDETNIQDITLESYRKNFAAVFQDTTLFNDTLRANLSFVRDNLTENELREACRDANILEFIDSLPDGLETIVGERGLRLSGGEKQRISMARAILADPKVLILDEATSALDAKTEKLVGDSLEKLMKGRTSLIIAHRLSTIKRADRIYLLEAGRIIGEGSHAELYASSSIYKEMVDFQKDGFIE